MLWHVIEQKHAVPTCCCLQRDVTTTNFVRMSPLLLSHERALKQTALGQYQARTTAAAKGSNLQPQTGLFQMTRSITLPCWKGTLPVFDGLMCMFCSTQAAPSCQYPWEPSVLWSRLPKPAQTAAGNWQPRQEAKGALLRQTKDFFLYHQLPLFSHLAINSRQSKAHRAEQQFTQAPVFIPAARLLQEKKYLTSE